MRYTNPVHASSSLFGVNHVYFAYLAGEDEEEGDEEGHVLAVEDAYRGHEIHAEHCASAGVGEDGDQDMLLHVEWPRIEGERPRPAPEEGALRQCCRHEAAQRKHGDLRRDGGDGERLLAIPEESVEEGKSGAGRCAQHPHPERQHRRRRVVPNRHRQRHLLDRRGGVVVVVVVPRLTLLFLR